MKLTEDIKPVTYMKTRAAELLGLVLILSMPQGTGRGGLGKSVPAAA